MKRKNIKKRILGVFLALAVIFSILPITSAVFADEVIVTQKQEQVIEAADLNYTYSDDKYGQINATTTGNGALSYAVTKGQDVIDVTDSGELFIRNAGEATVTVTAAATDEYEAAVKDVKVTVAKKNMKGSSLVMMAISWQRYTGQPLTPIPTIKTSIYGDTLVLGKDYEIEKYENNVNVGKDTARIYIRPLPGGNYDFYNCSFTFDIMVALGVIEITGNKDVVYDGAPVEVGEGKDFNFTYNGDGNVTITWYADNNGQRGEELAEAPMSVGAYWIGAYAPMTEKYGYDQDYMRFVISYVVSFNANGGTGEMAPVVAGTDDYTLPENGFTAPSGKRFKGWGLSADGEPVEGTSVVLTDNTTLYAIWEDIPEYSITVNKGQAYDNWTGRVISKAAEKTPITIKADAAPVGEVFERWAVVSGTVSLANENDAQTTFEMPAGPVELEALYKKAVYTVSFDANGGTGEMAPVSAVYGRYTLPENGFTAPSGKRFKGWSLSATGATILSAEQILLTDNITLYAVWENDDKAVYPTDPPAQTSSGDVSAAEQTTQTDTIKPNGEPKTGDVQNTGVWIALAALSATGVAAIGLSRKSKKRKS